MTPEEREALQRTQAALDRQYEEAVRARRAQIDAQITSSVRTYTTTVSSSGMSYWTAPSSVSFIQSMRLAEEGSLGIGIDSRRDINYDAFFNPPAMNPTPPTLNERLQAAIQEADRCSRRGDRLGHINALHTAAQLRRQIRNQSATSII